MTVENKIVTRLADFAAALERGDPFDYYHVTTVEKLVDVDALAVDLLGQLWQRPLGGPHDFTWAKDLIADALAKAARQATAAARQACAALLEAEADAFAENGQACDRTGNTFGGTVDAAGASTCRRMAAALRARGTAPDTPPPSPDDWGALLAQARGERELG